MIPWTLPLLIADLQLPFRLEYCSWWTAALFFLLLATPIVLLGMHSLAGMTGVRKWVTIGVRLAVLLVLVALLAGLRWQRAATNVEVYCLRDASDSTTMVQDYPGPSLQRSIDQYFMALAKDPRKKPDDKIGVVGFRGIPLVEAIADTSLSLDGRGTPVSSSGTNIASALQLAMASMSPDTMHRILLLSDGNPTTGDLNAAVSLAASMHIPIDVLPLDYDLKHEIMMERVVAPSWRRENEPFSLDVYIRSTNDVPVTGKVVVMHETSDGKVPLTGHPVPMTLQPGLNHEAIQIPAMKSTGVHRFSAEFVPDPGQGQVDTLAGNNAGDAFTVVRGKGEVLYVNNSRDAAGNLDETLSTALRNEKINLHEITVDSLPNDLMYLQGYDVVILDNAPRGSGGVTTDQDTMLSHYVHDFGGGLVMIGGDHAFGAGGWAGSEVEKVLPVDMDIPAQRMIGKGALVLIMDPGEISDGAYWGEQCALQAIDALSAQDEVGIVDYNPMGGGCEWVLPLREKGDGNTVKYAIKKMHDGDLPNFDDALQLALKGGPGSKGLAASDARQKHVIIISDGDSMGTQEPTIQEYLNNKISVSTVTAYAEDPSNPNVPPQMSDIAKATHGRSYGPINTAPNQLPQIFIKEAQIVRRSLIQENENGIPVRLVDASDELVRGMGHIPPVFGQVLTSRKVDPGVEMPLVSGKMSDPILAHWQAGLGKSVVFTSDARPKWGALWVSSPSYAKFWTQVIRSVSRAPQSPDFEVDTQIDAGKGHIRVQAIDAEGGGRNFLNIGGAVVGPDMKNIPVRLDQTAPGVYEGDFPAAESGTYVAGLRYGDSNGKSGLLMSGVSMDSSPEMRDLHSNDAQLEEIRLRTGGRRITSWDAADADIFTREGLAPAMQSAPLWDILLMILLGLVLTDVGVRRIAWDWQSTRKMAAAVANQVRSFTTLRRGDAISTLAALKDVRRDVVTRRTEALGRTLAGSPPIPAPDPKARFTVAKGVEGDITKLVGGAKAVAIDRTTGIEKAADNVGYTSGLLDAKRRARERILRQSEDAAGTGEPKS
jgi:Ca-activated chloride channel family protein